MKKTALPILCMFLIAAPVSAQSIGIRPRQNEHALVQRVASLVQNQRAQRLAQAKGLGFVNVMWEDTGRYLGSSVGPNISDVTIEVEYGGGQQRQLMPVIRYPNFSDKTGDVELDQFFIRVGNEKKGRPLRTVSLKEFLRQPTRYMSLPNKGRIKGKTLLAKRDTHVLTSAQHAFLPVPKKGKATFYPVIFNYQSYAGNPAVLTILVTRQGTSMTIVDNTRNRTGNSWGQRLFFNKEGQRAPLLAERLTDVKTTGLTANGEDASSLGDDANLLMLIQVPLKVKRRHRGGAFGSGIGGGGMVLKGAPVPAGAPMADEDGAAMEVAVLGHGPTEGPYTELDGLTIERDPRFPIRATVQFYQATQRGTVSAREVARMHAQITKVYDQASYVGSLVVPSGDENRPTEWTGATHMSCRHQHGFWMY